MQKLRMLWRVVVFACASMVIALTMMLWSATGSAGYTKFHDAERAEREAQASEGSLEDLFSDTGIEALPEVENRFALGLAPSGPGKHSASVITIAGPAAIIALGSLGSFVLLLKKKAEPTRDSAS